MVNTAWLITFCILLGSKSRLVTSRPYELSTEDHERILAETSQEWVQAGGNIDAGTSDYRESPFRARISGDGSTVAVGVPYANGGRGLVIVSRYDAAEKTWVRLGSAIADGGVRLASAGASVSLSRDGTILAVGFPAYLGWLSQVRYGMKTFARVYRWNRQEGDWEQLGSDIFDDELFQHEEDKPDFFVTIRAGWSVSLSDDGGTLAVGAPNYFVKGRGIVGQTRIYRYDDASAGDWVQRGDPIFDATVDRRDGFSVQLSGDASSVAIGSPEFYADSPNGGSVGVFRWDNAARNWAQFGNKIVGESGDKTGYSVSLSSDGSLVAVGHPGHNEGVRGMNRGLVRVYRMDRTNLTWGRVGSDILPESGWTDYGHGESVSLSGKGDTVAVAAPGLSVNSVVHGLARVYRINSTTAAWDLVDRAIPGEGDHIGSDYTLNTASLSSDGTRLAVGAPIHVVCPDLDFSCTYSPGRYENWTGHVRAFDLVNSTTSSPTALPSTVVPTKTPSTSGVPTGLQVPFSPTTAVPSIVGPQPTKPSESATPTETPSTGGVPTRLPVASLPSIVGPQPTMPSENAMPTETPSTGGVPTRLPVASPSTDAPTRLPQPTILESSGTGTILQSLSRFLVLGTAWLVLLL